MRDEKYILMVLFDLPNTTKKEVAAYRRFRKCLIDEGYMLFQESVYVRMFHRRSNITAEIVRIRKHMPDEGNIVALPLKATIFQNLIVLNGNSVDSSLLMDDFLFI